MVGIRFEDTEPPTPLIFTLCMSSLSSHRHSCEQGLYVQTYKVHLPTVL